MSLVMDGTLDFYWYSLAPLSCDFKNEIWCEVFCPILKRSLPEATIGPPIKISPHGPISFFPWTK